MRGMTGGNRRERQPESVACGAADDPARTCARYTNANGARNRFRAPLSPAGARSIWRLPFRLGGGQVPSSVPHPRHCCPFREASRLRSSRLRVSTGFRRNLSGGPKGPAIIDRIALPASDPFSCEPGPAAITSPGGGTLVPDRSPKPLLRIPERRIRTAFPLSFRVVRTWPKPCPSFRFRAAFKLPLRLTSPCLQPVFPRSEDRVRSAGAPAMGPHRL